MLNVIAGLGFAAFLLGAIVLRATERLQRAEVQVVLDALGVHADELRDHDVGPRDERDDRPVREGPEIALQPLGLDELSPWLLYNFTRLPEDGQARAAAYILERAETARRRAATGGRVGDFERYLGPLTAPYFLLHPHRWSRPERAPQRPFVRLRVYHLTWERGTGIVARDLEYETR